MSGWLLVTLSNATPIRECVATEYLTVGCTDYGPGFGLVDIQADIDLK